MAWLEAEYRKSSRGTSKGILHVEVEKARGLMVHMVCTYPPNLSPHLKVRYLTLCLWLPGRYKDGWKMWMKGSKEGNYLAIACKGKQWAQSGQQVLGLDGGSYVLLLQVKSNVWRDERDL
jgi:hypothetical protein